MSISKQKALDYHQGTQPGKVEVVSSKPCRTQRDRSLAYAPGVAQPCLEIEKHPLDAYKYTQKENLVAVVSNGTAVLGLGDIGALAGKPSWKGKACASSGLPISTCSTLSSTRTMATKSKPANSYAKFRNLKIVYDLSCRNLRWKRDSASR